MWGFLPTPRSSHYLCTTQSKVPLCNGYTTRSVRVARVVTGDRTNTIRQRLQLSARNIAAAVHLAQERWHILLQRPVVEHPAAAEDAGVQSPQHCCQDQHVHDACRVWQPDRRTSVRDVSTPGLPHRDMCRTGRRSVTQVPTSTSDAIETLPPCNSATSFTNARPSPVPGIADCGLARKNRLNAWSSC